MANFPVVPLIQDQTNVSQAITNQPINALIERTQYLKEQIDSLILSSQRLVMKTQDCDDLVLDSQLVYLDNSTNKWKLSLANPVITSGSTEIELESRSFVQGIAKNITGTIGSKKADIYIFGLINGVISTNILESGSPVIGAPYYLSITVPGKLTAVKPNNIEIFVGKFVSLTNFLITPQFSINEDDHIHRWIYLDYANFITLAPGEYLYPASSIPSYPPTPLDSGTLFVNGLRYDYNDEFDFQTDGLHYYSLIYPPDPDPNIFTAVLHYVVTPASSLNVVTSLCPGSVAVEIVDKNTLVAAFVGDLQINFTPILTDNLLVSNANCVKNITYNPTTGTFTLDKGNFVQSLTAGVGIGLSATVGDITISNTGSIITTAERDSFGYGILSRTSSTIITLSAPFASYITFVNVNQKIVSISSGKTYNFSTTNTINSSGVDSGLLPLANTFYYVYLSNSMSTIPEELRISTTAPTGNYLGTVGNPANWKWVGYVATDTSTATVANPWQVFGFRNESYEKGLDAEIVIPNPASGYADVIVMEKVISGPNIPILLHGQGTVIHNPVNNAMTFAVTTDNTILGASQGYPEDDIVDHTINIIGSITESTLGVRDYKLRYNFLNGVGTIIRATPTTKLLLIRMYK